MNNHRLTYAEKRAKLADVRKKFLSKLADQCKSLSDTYNTADSLGIASPKEMDAAMLYAANEKRRKEAHLEEIRAAAAAQRKL